MSENTILTLYQYLHCPYCIRVRLALGFLEIPYTSVILPYSDEETPLKMTGQKMAPILQKEDGSYMNESLDIIHYLDTKQLLNISSKIAENSLNDINQWLSQLSKPLFNLLMPYYLNSIEFSDKDRLYFQRKKEKKRGPFTELVKKRSHFIEEIDQHLNFLQGKLKPFFENEKMQIHDILIASHLWRLLS